MRKSVRHCQLAMRRGILYLMLSCVCFITQAQDNTSPLQSTITLTGHDISLLQIFQAIKKQTGFTLVYSNQLLNDSEKRDVNFSKVSLQEVLASLFKDKKISYEVKNNRIVLDRKAPVTAVPLKEGKQESRIVKGQVMDVQGHPLPGVTVTITGTTKGVITDELGIFSIETSDNDILKVAMMGMNQEEVKVSGQKTLKVTLTEKVDKLNEVVVVGFGSQKKITVTGSVSTVNMEDMRMPVRSLTNALAGKVAGVISMQSGGGEPGYDNPNFTIRGIGTFTGSTSPLIIVDGVQRDDVNSTFGGAFNNIDPEDVQSISLLKDASATAIYGAKGANGVLIITTKRGVAGKPRISAKVETGVNGLTRLPKMLDGINYMKLYNEARVNDNNDAIYSDEVIQKTASGLDPYLYPNVNWINTIYKEYTPMTNANLNVSGGGEAMRYYVSMSFYNQDGQYKVKDLSGYNPNLNFKRYDFRSNVDLNVTKTTILSLNIAAMLVNSRYPGTSAADIWYAAYATNPVAFPVKYPGNLWAGPRNNGGSNPFNLVQNAGYSSEFKPSVQSVLTLNQKLDAVVPGLSAMGRFSFDTYGEFNTTRSGNNDLWYAGSRNSEGDLVLERVRNGSTYLGYSTSSRGERIMYLEGNIAYDRTYGNHTFGGLLVGTMRSRVIGVADNVKQSIPFRNQSMAGRLTYSYMDKYLAEVNVGATGSENFEAGHRWGYFPAVSAGWVISKEDFFAPFSHTVNLLKIRASVGMTGNDQLGTNYRNDRYGYLTYIQDGQKGISFGSSPTAYGGVAASVIGTQNLTWEKSAKTDIGLEVGLWNKLSLTIDAFNDKRTAILIGRQSISSIAGYSDLNIYANMGEMQNRGIDGSLEYSTRIGKDISLRIFGNLTYAKNKIIYADNPKFLYPYQQPEGHRFGEYKGYVSKGLFVDQNDVDKSPTQTRIVFPGDIKYEDMNGDGNIDSNDGTYLGKSSFPTWSYGYGFNFGYKKISLSAIFSGVADVGIMANGTDITTLTGAAPGVGVVPFTGIGQYPANVLSNSMDRWTKENPRQDVDYPRLTITNTSDNNYVNSSWWLKDGSFMRLKQVSLGYSLITPDMKKKGISNLEFYAAGTNLLTFSKFKLWDPELGGNGAKYPYAKTITVGVRAQF
ncbi:TonB-linked outer membrane protein, SusC/RagA family [Chitinophaga sp. CF118]|uniref:TonB-dependent receptor n=1 Tax=Chitinophaga sp. CF118 TaxID=1884367 RepID=UPI0008ED7BD1|nr:TonB-dependent receptor [Chitinophaga sp. CF118]SFD02244.1 TonB-linked outer membrane protein, SusC/RagA family [Chitinophaga sp. CF118]